MSVGFGRVINRNYSDTKQRVPLAAGFSAGLLNAGSPLVIHIAHSADGMKNLLAEVGTNSDTPLAFGVASSGGARRRGTNVASSKLDLRCHDGC